MKVLFVTTDFYPDFGTTVNIFKKLFYEGGLIDKIDNISVITLKSNFLSKDYEYIDGIHVYRCTFLGWIQFNELAIAWKELGLLMLFKTAFLKAEQKIRYKFKDNCLLRNRMVNVLLEKMKEIDADSYDFIIPIFGNYDSVGAVMKYQPKRAKTVLYQVDPCSTNWTRPKREYKRSLQFELKMYEEAAAVLTMPVIYKEVQQLISERIKSKFYPMELPLISKPCDVRAENKRDNKIQCVFSGLIYLGIRDPSYTLKIFKPFVEEGKVSLHMVGVDKSELPEEFREMDICCYGRVKSDVAQKIMNQADVLVNIGNLMTNQIPSKIFDYISQGKTIVNVCKNHNCPTIPYMSEYPLSINLFEDDKLLDSQVKQLRVFLDENSKKRIEFNEIENLFKKATPKYCANLVYELLNNLSKN